MFATRELNFRKARNGAFEHGFRKCPSDKGSPCMEG